MRISDWSSDVCSSDLEQHVDFEILRAQRFEVFRKAGNFRRGFACIDADRQLLVATVAAPQRAADEWADQLQGQIVDAVVTDILVLLERDGLSGTGQAADEDQLHGRFAADRKSTRLNSSH